MAFAAGAAALRRLGPPPVQSVREQRDAALNLLQRFARFAEQACGCHASSNRAHVRRAVFHCTERIDLEPFVATRLQGDLSAMESIARMECPVTMPDKTMVKVRVAESAPKRIVFAAKVLRRHLSLTETQTCRGCLKRSRCRFFKAPAGEETNAGVGHVGRVLFGMAQYARAHLQYPEVYPWYYSSDNIRSATVLMTAIDAHLKEDGSGLLLEEVEVADSRTAREILLDEARRKEAKRRSFAEERYLALPQWMRDTLEPVPGPGMSQRQRSILAEGGIEEAESGDEASKQDALTSGDETTKDWVEEGSMPGEPSGPLLFDPLPEPRGTSKSDLTEERPLTVVDGFQDLPVIKRFKHLAPKSLEQPVQRLNSLSQDMGIGIFQAAGGKMHRIDLDSVDSEADDASRWEEILTSPQQATGKLDALGLSMKGGYTISDMLGNGAIEDAQRFVSISPGALEGVHQYGSGITPKVVDPAAFEEIWKRAESRGKRTELPFLRRVPFDTGFPGRSGGSEPPDRLPKEMVIDQPEPFLPPASKRKPLEMLDDEPDHETPSASTLATDKQLATDALELRTGGLRNMASDMKAIATDSSSHASSGDTKLDEQLVEDKRFESWMQRPKTRGVGVFDPAIDFRESGDPKRLETVGSLDAETSNIFFRSGRPLPKDEVFVSTFRKPLHATGAVDEDTADPLGAAAPGIDLEALKAAVPKEPAAADSALMQQMQQEPEAGLIFPRLPAAGLRRESDKTTKRDAKLAFAKAGGGGASSTKQPAWQSQLKQVRLGDNLSDLMKPPTSDTPLQRGGRGRRTVGEVSYPEQDSDAAGAVSELQTPRLGGHELRQHRNAAMAAQQMLHRRLKQSVQKQTSGSMPSRRRMS